LWPRTLVKVAEDEPVLIDLRFGWTRQRCVLRAVARFTIPEGRGPMFVLDRRDRAAIDFIAGGASLAARAHVRFPVALHAAIRREARTPRRATLIDLSSAGARVESDQELTVGEPLKLDLPSVPQTIDATALAPRGEHWVIRFTGPSLDGWRYLRHLLRVADQTGRFRVPV
jgi:hypothetical protein